MLERIDELVLHLGERALFAALADDHETNQSARHDLAILRLLRDEVAKRLEFEHAVLAYLNEAGSNPHHAANQLRVFITRDHIEEAT